MSQQSIDYLVSLLSAAVNEISVLKSKLAIDKLQSEKTEIFDVINALRKYKPCYVHTDNISKFNDIIKNEKFHKLLNFEKFDLKLLFNDIAKLQSEKTEIFDIINALRKYESLYAHADNILKINYIIKNKKFHKLLNFNKFDLKLLFKDIGQILILSTDDNIIMHIIDNCINLEEISENFNSKLIHHFASSNLKLDIIKYLIDKNIDLMHQNIYGNTPLHLVCVNFNGRKDIIEYLIEKTDKVDIENIHKMTPVQFLKNNQSISNDERKSLIMKFEAKQK